VPLVIRRLLTRSGLLRPQRWNAGGFTLLEALVVVSLVGVLLAMAVPSLSDWRTRHQTQAQAEGLLSSLVLARTEALHRQQRVSLCAQGGRDRCDSTGAWQQGWLVFVDDNQNGLREAGETLIEAHAAAPAGVRLASNSTARAYFSYNSEGRSMATNGAFMAATWRFCPLGGEVGWQVVSNALGKARIERYTPQECP
jgi:type IV fimbrial biogenesis protein FimT